VGVYISVDLVYDAALFANAVTAAVVG